jgi:hypothetical protein
MSKVENSAFATKIILLMLLADSFIWVRSSYGKITGGNFVSTLGGTLTKFASNNPYPWFKTFLQNTAIPNSQTFGMLTMTGEAFAAAAMTLATLYMLIKGVNKFGLVILMLGLAVSAFLNLIFWLASGYTSASTDGLNLFMFLFELIAFVYAAKLAASK